MNKLLKIKTDQSERGLLMEHTLAITVCALLLTAVLVLGLFALTGFFSLPEETALAAENSAIAEEPAPQKLVLGIFEEKLALFVGTSPYPNKIYDFYARNLPLEDRERLLKGIEVASEEELFALLEDFTS